MFRLSSHIGILFLILWVIICVGKTIAQQPDTLSSRLSETDITDRIEQIAEKTDADLDYSELIESLRYYRDHPLNLNYATRDELTDLVFLNEMQIFHLMAYRENYGLLISVYELQGIEGFDAITINKIIPYVMVSERPPPAKIPLRNALKYGRHQIILRYQKVLQERTGYNDISDSAWIEKPNSHYLGSDEKWFFKYGFRYGNKIRWGITTEKDPGETIFINKIPDSIQQLAGHNLRNGFDFYSGHVSLNDIGHLKSLTIGDYQLRFGQGLTMWGGLAFGKSSDAANVKRFGTGITPYTSADENRFFRGAATTVRLGDFEVSAFYSNNKIDAALDASDTLDTDEGFITSLQETGNHRTVNEIQKKDAIHMEVMGGHIHYQENRLSMGVTGAITRMDLPLGAAERLYDRYTFEGDQNINAGMDYAYLLNKISLFGEVSMSRNGALAQLHGLSAALHPILTISLLYRNYEPEYQNLFANAFSESNSYNERGFYSGLRLLLAPKWSLTAYMDIFNYPWLRYRVDGPSSGNEGLVQVEHVTSGNVGLNFRFKQQTKQINGLNELVGLDPLTTFRKSSIRFHINYKVSPVVRMANRAEYLIYHDDAGYRGTGYLVYHDVHWRPANDNLTLFFRYAIFDTDSYDERIYAYENDVLYAFSVPAYYYKGSKTALMLKYTLFGKINIWARISHLWFANQNTIGTGLDEIDGDQKTEVKVQVQIKL
ncbi:MAG: helix-hairpin-helix domain-containing protein [Bacteroidetes bacterium]|nr:helix-hairpin-helix domain-containing protein [Bacteroidota bacterium]